MTQGQHVFTTPDQVSVVPTANANAARLHQRAVVTTTAGKLESFLSGSALPTFYNRAGQVVRAQYIQLQVEAGQTPGQVYVTWDGGSSPEVSATYGGLVATAPAWTTIPASDALYSIGGTGGIRLVAVTNTTNVQVFFGV